MENNIKQELKEFISKYIKNYDLKDDENIFEIGFVNSLFAMQLVMFLEKKIGIKIENIDLIRDNFESINAIMALIEKNSVK